MMSISSAKNTKALQDSESRDCEVSSCYTADKRNSAAQNDENAAAAGSVESSSDEDDASEGPSIDVDRAENPLAFATDLESSVEKETESALHERADRLWSEMSSLRTELSKEVALWKREKEEFQVLRERSDALAFEEATAAARAAAAAYAVESPLSNDSNNIVDITSKESIRELAILEYERNLAKYQTRHSVEQAEQRYNAYKHALVDAYKQKLCEVERLCNEELERIRQSADYLQPFQKIASQWSVDENNRGDSNRGLDDRPVMELSKIVETSNNDCCVHGKIDSEVNMVPEILSARFKREGTT